MPVGEEYEWRLVKMMDNPLIQCGPQLVKNEGCRQAGMWDRRPANNKTRGF